MGPSLLQDRAGLCDSGALRLPAPVPPAPGVRWPTPRPPGPSPLPGRLAAHAHAAETAEAEAREAALTRRWPWSALAARDARLLASDVAAAGLLQDAVATLTGELRAANARIERLELALEARAAQVVCALADRLLAGQLDGVRGDVRESRTALDVRMNLLEAALEERFSWLALDLDALEVRVRLAATRPDRSPEDPVG